MIIDCHSHFPGVFELELLIALVCLKDRILSSELFPFSESSFSRMDTLASLWDGVDLEGEAMFSLLN